jgi:hypothetical protein
MEPPELAHVIRKPGAGHGKLDSVRRNSDLSHLDRDHHTTVCDRSLATRDSHSVDSKPLADAILIDE